MVETENLQQYSNSVKRLKQQCTEAGISDEEFRKLYFESLQSIETQIPNVRCTWYKRSCVVLTIVAFAIIITVNLKSLYSCITCSLQEYIYPGLRILRKLSIPFISLFPSLTVLYHETCLIQNPFFSVVDMDCWPCSYVNSIREIHDPKPVTEQHTAPFIYETDQNVINVETLQDLYLNHKDLFDREAPKVITNNKAHLSPHEMFLKQQSGEKLYHIWKLNTMNVAKVLRQAIPRPKVVPKFGQSTERFLIMDTSQESLRLPDTECNFSFLLSLIGSRTIEILPAEECKHHCRTLTVDLKETYLLWYNWW